MAEIDDLRVAGWVIFPPDADVPDRIIDEGAIFSVQAREFGPGEFSLTMFAGYVLLEPEIMEEDGSIVRPEGSQSAIQRVTADTWDKNVRFLMVDVSMDTGDGTARNWCAAELIFAREEPLTAN